LGVIGHGSPAGEPDNAMDTTSNPFFDHPVLNSPYKYPRKHWELDEFGQPTQKIIEDRRSAKFITPIPKPKKRKAAGQTGFVFDEGKGLSTKEQQYDPTSIINEVRGYVDAWRSLPNPNQWQVSNRELIITLAAQRHLPAVYHHRLFVASGGLISYGPDLRDEFRLAAG
jgi:hypothetical protein